MPRTPAKPSRSRSLPKFEVTPEGSVSITTETEEQLHELFGLQTPEAANGLMLSAMNALGRSGEHYRPFLAAMAVEIEPRDAIEAMLVVQMTATHTAMTEMARRMTDTTGGYQMRESLERSMTRLSRTYLGQMEALKKHRAKAQQTVRVERVNVESGGQAVVGNIQHGGGGVVMKGDDNPMSKAHAAPRCIATSKRTGVRCKGPAVRGWRVCRFHGAGGGHHAGEDHPSYRHGNRGREWTTARREIQELVRILRAT